MNLNVEFDVEMAARISQLATRLKLSPEELLIKVVATGMSVLETTEKVGSFLMGRFKPRAQPTVPTVQTPARETLETLRDRLQAQHPAALFGPSPIGEA